MNISSSAAAASSSGGGSGPSDADDPETRQQLIPPTSGPAHSPKTKREDEGGGGTGVTPNILKPPPITHSNRGSLSQESRESADISLGGYGSSTNPSPMGSSYIRLNPLSAMGQYSRDSSASAPHAATAGSAAAAGVSVPDMDVTELDLELPYRPLRSHLQPEGSYESTQSHFIGGGSRESVHSERGPVHHHLLRSQSPYGLAAPGRNGGGGGSVPIRQHSQPEASHLCTHLNPPPYSTGFDPSLSPGSYGGSPRSLLTSSHTQLGALCPPGEGIAAIAADSLRINGALRQFKQVGGNNEG